MEKQTNYPTENLYSISILITQNGYSFYDYYPNQKKIDVFISKVLEDSSPEVLWAKLQQDLVKHKLLKDENTNVNITYHHPYFAVVPDEIYDPNFNSDYLKFNTELFEFDTIANDFNSQWSVCIPFIPYQNIHNELLNSFKQIEFTHSINSCLRVCASLNKTNTDQNVFVFKNATTFILVILKENKLIYCNYFAYSTPEDFVYYLLFALEQLDCNRNEINFYAIGKIPIEGKLYEYLYTYIKTIHLISPSDLQPNVNIPNYENEADDFITTNPFLALHLCV